MRSIIIGLIGALSFAASPALAADAATQEANKKTVLELGGSDPTSCSRMPTSSLPPQYALRAAL